MDFVGQLGTFAFGTRLKRLSDEVLRQGGLVYRSQNVDFEPRWFTIVCLLRSEDRAFAITEIANRLGLTHPAVIKTTAAMVKKGVLLSMRDPNDSRRHLVRLSSVGLAMVPELEPIWEAFEQVAKELFEEISVDVIAVIEKMEDALSRRGFDARVTQRIKERQYHEVEVIDYRPELSEHFRDLNQEWLTRYFTVEPADERMLADPQGEIIKKGGHILFARLHGEIVGTIALCRRGAGVFELAKMAVTERAKGKQAGKKLARAALDRARQGGAQVLVLRTDARLHAAVRLYRSLGFEIADVGELLPEDTERSRRGFAMRLDLTESAPMVSQ
ncbi:bifunctional helix-turn-helix transcriptional regulator/GNAT family N-acetyltransferase [Candidatus Fermentibacteria bacterium]|nr:bifunctional helix-turn-helix transcriptional regulator/GNAT family N-acetyltransferase [Candidatus Fermentibacteria bacterium]